MLTEEQIKKLAGCSIAKIVAIYSLYSNPNFNNIAKSFARQNTTSAHIEAVKELLDIADSK